MNVSRLEEWRPDAPWLWPTCANLRCGREIRAGDRYVVLPNSLSILCAACVAEPVETAERPAPAPPKVVVRKPHRPSPGSAVSPRPCRLCGLSFQPVKNKGQMICGRACYDADRARGRAAREAEREARRLTRASRWSPHAEACLKCGKGTAEGARHEARGLCIVCYRHWLYRRTPNRGHARREPVPCPQCGDMFAPRHAGHNRLQKFCSRACGSKYREQTRRTAVCPVCEKPFWQKSQHGGLQETCSRSCGARARRRLALVAGLGWSLKFDRCQVCGTTAKPHQAGGRCKNCYAWWLKHRGEEGV